MKTLTELIVRTANLAEAEGRLLRTMTVRVAIAIGIIIIAVGLAGAGLALLLAALYGLVAISANNVAAAGVTGVIALACGGLLVWTGRWLAR